MEVYLRIRQHCPAPFAGLVISDQQEAVLSSPERRRWINTAASNPTNQGHTSPPCRPRPRCALAAQLVCSDKDRAENVMIVDLLRNDLGRSCKPGSVQVPQLLGLESYALCITSPQLWRGSSGMV